jgi:hypothetical protein
MIWTKLSPTPGGDSPPVARNRHGFTSAGGKLYVHGGSTDKGNALGLAFTRCVCAHTHKRECVRLWPSSKLDLSDQTTCNHVCVDDNCDKRRNSSDYPPICPFTRCCRGPVLLQPCKFDLDPAPCNTGRRHPTTCPAQTWLHVDGGEALRSWGNWQRR